LVSPLRPLPDVVTITDPFFKGCENSCKIIMELPAIQSEPHSLDIMAEAAARFQQLHYVHSEVLALQEKALSSLVIAKGLAAMGSSDQNRSTLDQFKNDTETSGNLCVLYAEMFYVVAFRVVDITRVMNAKLFGTKRIISEPAGVRNARNLLILHPEQVKHGAVLSRVSTLRWADEAGIRLKELRSPHESREFQDPGFGPNCLEFREFWLNWSEHVYVKLTEA